MGSSLYERDFGAFSGLKRENRIDFLLFQNVDNAGDGYPGLQKAIRNWVKHYLKDGLMEDQIDMNSNDIVNINDIEASNISITGNITISGTVDGVDVSDLKTDVDGFPDELKNLTTAEIQQLENIDSTTISATQWGYLGSLNQDLATTDSPTFNNLTISSNITVSGTVDGVDVSALKTDVDGFPDELKNLVAIEIQQLENIGSTTISAAQWGYLGSMNQSLATSDSPTFNNLTINNNITVSGTVDGVDVSDLKSDVDGFPNELKNLTTAEIQQVENIGSSTISAAQWGYLGSMTAQPLENLVEDTTPQLGGNLDLNSKGFVATFTAEDSVNTGDLCFLNSSGKMQKTDADAESTANTLLAMAAESITAENSGKFLLRGYISKSGLSMGSIYYVSTSLGAITTSKPSGSGDIVRIVGYALSSSVLFFDPDKSYIKVL